VDGETLRSLILALFIGCTQLDAFLLDLIIFMITLQYSDVENSLRLSVYQYKLVTWVVEANHEWVSFFIVARNRPDGPKLKLTSVRQPVDVVELLIAIKNYLTELSISLASSVEYFVAEYFELVDCPDIWCVYLLNGELAERGC